MTLKIKESVKSISRGWSELRIKTGIAAKRPKKGSRVYLGEIHTPPIQRYVKHNRIDNLKIYEYEIKETKKASKKVFSRKSLYIGKQIKKAEIDFRKRKITTIDGKGKIYYHIVFEKGCCSHKVYLEIFKGVNKDIIIYGSIKEQIW